MVLQAKHGETIRTIDGILQLIATGHRSVFAKTRLDSEGCFAPRSAGCKTRGCEIANRRDGRGGKPLREEQFSQRTYLVRRAECRLGRIGWIRIAEVLLALDRELKLGSYLHVGSGGNQ